MLENHDDAEYGYVFHDVAYHKHGLDIKYAVSKIYYFQKEDNFYKQREMFQDDLESYGIKDEKSALNHVADLNNKQLKYVNAKRSELKSIQNAAPNSNKILNLIEFHDEIIGLLLD